MASFPACALFLVASTFSAPISPGSSGGGLFDEEGRLIGLPTFYLTEGQQLNFAVPVEWISELPQRHTETSKTSQTFIDWFNKAVELEEKQDWSGLFDHVLRWTKAEPDAALAWALLDLSYQMSGQTAKAIEASQRALHINSDDLLASVTWKVLGDAYRGSGQATKAIEAYQQALRINPKLDMAWFALAGTYETSGHPTKAIEAYRQGLQINPDDSPACGTCWASPA